MRPVFRDISFCGLIQSDYPPHTSYRLRRRGGGGALFRHGATFGLYISQLKNECRILNIPVCWGDSPSDGVINGG